jgi:hypothetical protein
MPKLKTIDIDPVDVDPDGLAQAQTPAAGGVQSLTLNGVLISGGTYTAGDGDGARQLSVLSAADDTGRTLTVTGTDADGRAQTEAIVPANAGTKEGVKYFKTVSSITVDADTAGALSVGTVDELVSPTYPLNRHSAVGALTQIDVTGTIDITVEVTASDIQSVSTDQESIPWVSTQDTGLVAITANDVGNLDAGATACRLKVNSHSSAAEVQMYISQTSSLV